MDGFLNLDKPTGFTSHDCVAKVRRLLRQKRVGHGGTLDPAATGVLPIALGRATRLLQYLPTGKAYRGTVRFGVQTTTDDLAGEVIRAEPAPTLTLEQVRSHLPSFLGQIQQIPPQYSAIQIDGKRLYDRARAGEVIEVPVRTVEIYDIQVLDWRSQDYPELDLAIACGAGTYIRAIARDLGDRLGTGGTLAALTRTHSGGFDLTDSLTLSALTAQIESGRFAPTPPQTLLAQLPTVTLPTPIATRWSQGQKIPWEQPTGEQIAIVQTVNPSGEFLGISETIATPAGTVLAPRLVWL